MLVDCITGLPISEITTTADVADNTVVEDILSQTNDFLSIDECTFIADKSYDVKAVYNLVKNVYHGECTLFFVTSLLFLCFFLRMILNMLFCSYLTLKFKSALIIVIIYILKFYKFNIFSAFFVNKRYLKSSVNESMVQIFSIHFF